MTTPAAILAALDEAAPLSVRRWLRAGDAARRAQEAIARVRSLPPAPVEFPISDEALTRALDAYSRAHDRLLPTGWFPVQVSTPTGPVTVEFAPPLRPIRGMPRTGFRVRFAGVQAQHKAPNEPGRVWAL